MKPHKPTHGVRRVNLPKCEKYPAHERVEVLVRTEKNRWHIFSARIFDKKISTEATVKDLIRAADMDVGERVDWKEPSKKKVVVGAHCLEEN